jgi:putative exosortase-associated protein (TIGR04073 family)
MRIYWWVMGGLMLFPWFLALVPAIAAAYRKIALNANHHSHVRWVRAAMIMLMVVSAAPVAVAGDVGTTPGHRLHDGLRDLTTGWTALFQTLGAETAERGPVAGLFVGSLEGANQALQQTLRGAYDTTTFLLPVPRPQPVASEPGTLLEVRF